MVNDIWTIKRSRERRDASKVVASTPPEIAMRIRMRDVAVYAHLHRAMEVGTL